MERKWRALLIVCVAIFMLLLDITIVNVALPSIQRDLHTSFTDLQWVVDAYALLLATSVLNAGTLGDWLGRKRVFIGGVGLAVAIGPLAGGVLTEYAGWRWIFFVNVPIGIACIFGALAYLHESRDDQHVGFDLAGFAFLTAGLFALVLALLRGESWGW